MIRPFTFVTMLLAGGAGLYLYTTKHQAQLLDREIGRVIKQTDTARERIEMLRAEWALLNEPDRLAELAKAHLNLKTLAPTQFVALNDLATRLPPPAPPGTLPPPPGMEEAAPAPAPQVAQAVPPARLAARPAPTPVPTSAPAPAPAAPPPAPATLAAAPAPSGAAEPRNGAVRHAAHPVAVATLAEPAPHPRAETARSETARSETARSELGRSEPGHSEPARHAVAFASAPEPAQVARPRSAPAVIQASASTAFAHGAMAPGTIGESVMRTMRSHGSAPAAPAAPVAYARSPAVTAPAYAAPAPSYAANAVYERPAAYAPPAVAMPQASGSLLGGARSALPPPVPFAAR